MLNYDGFKNIVKSHNIIKTVMEVKKENKKVRPPRQSTVDKINVQFRDVAHGLSREKLLKRTKMSRNTLDNALRYLVLHRDLIQRATGKAGPHAESVYLLVKG
jgi:hypothetical protein